MSANEGPAGSATAVQPIPGVALNRGRARAVPLRLDEPLSFWGGFDLRSGTVTDRNHPQCGQVLTGRAVIMEAGRGSSSASSVLAEAIRIGTAPAAIILYRCDPVIAIGARVAAELYAIFCPVVSIDESAGAILAAAECIDIDADTDTAMLTPEAAGGERWIPFDNHGAR